MAFDLKKAFKEASDAAKMATFVAAGFIKEASTTAQAATAVAAEHLKEASTTTKVAAAVAGVVGAVAVHPLLIGAAAGATLGYAGSEIAEAVKNRKNGPQQ